MPRIQLPCLTFSLLSAFALLLAGPALAVDGVIEISHAKALAGGVTGGAADSPGYPVTLSVPGSYRLTSNLEVDSLNTTAIEVTADDVAIDLNGFVIQNRTPCRPDCGQPGSGYGIDAGTSTENTGVRNGTIIGMGSDAIRVGDDSFIREIRAIGSGDDGIHAGSRSTVRDCIVDGAGGRGIRVNLHGAVYDSTVRGAGDVGIIGATGTTVSGSRVTGSTSFGIQINGKRGSVTRNVVENNAAQGVDMADGVLAENVISGNIGPGVFLHGGKGGVVRGNQFSENTSAIDCGSQSVIITENVISSNTTLAILCQSTAGYSGNVFSGNGGSPQIVGPVEMNQNVCDGNTTCP